MEWPCSTLHINAKTKMRCIMAVAFISVLWYSCDIIKSVRQEPAPLVVISNSVRSLAGNVGGNGGSGLRYVWFSGGSRDIRRCPGCQMTLGDQKINEKKVILI